MKQDGYVTQDFIRREIQLPLETETVKKKEKTVTSGQF